MSQCRVPWLVRLLYTHNPFYLISACLFTYGLKLLFRVGDSAILFQQGTVGYMQPVGLMGSLLAVTLLMATTAVLIVRLGHVWEDARSLVLIVLLMLLAISVSFDELLMTASELDDGLLRSLTMMSIGVMAAIGITEMLIRGLRVRFAWSWRIPLYLLLALFFLWPVLLLREIMPWSQQTMRWLIAGFPTVAGLIALLLIPGIRKGSQAVRDNGTPWTWPWIPWTHFVFVALAVCFRSYSLTISFDAPKLEHAFWDSVFGMYQLVPFFAVILVLLIEIGVTERRDSFATSVLLISPTLMLLATPWGVPWKKMPSYESFALTVSESLGSPVFVAMLLVLAICFLALLRRVRGGEGMVYTMLLVAMIVGPNAWRWPGAGLMFDGLHTWPVCVAAALKIVLGIRRHRPTEILIGGLLCAALPLVVSLPSYLVPWRVFLALHLALFIVLLAGLWLPQVNRSLQKFNAVQLTATMLVGMLLLLQNGMSGSNILVYAAGMTIGAVGCFQMTGERWYLAAAAIHCLTGAGAGSVASSWMLATTRMESGLRLVILGAISFAAAVLISTLKSGSGRWLRIHCLLWKRNTLHWLNQ
jgi:hypothetical protein